jgi:hypothetical protein
MTVDSSAFARNIVAIASLHRYGVVQYHAEFEWRKRRCVNSV